MTGTAERVEGEPEAPQLQPSERTVDQSARLAVVTFAVLLVVAAVMVLTRLGTYTWFFSDDWSWLGERSARSPDALLRSYNDHWSTVPFVLWRVMYEAFGVESYRPYMAVLVATHLGVVVGLRMVMRRSGVGPWTATVTASVLLLFGSGEQAITFASVLNFNLAMLLVLAYLLLVDNDDPTLGRNDWIGLAVGFVAIMTSGIAVAGIGAVALTVLVRRGGRPAAFHTVPLASIYLLWYAIFHTPALVIAGVGNPGPSDLVSWVWKGGSTAFVRLGTTPWGFGGVVGTLLVAVAIGGLLLGIQRHGTAFLRGPAIAPLGLMLAAMGFLAMSGWGRAAIIPDTANGSRYLYLVVAWSLPLIAIGAQQIGERRKAALPVVWLLLVVGVPWNISQFGTSVFGESYFVRYRTVMTAIAHDPRLDDVPASVHPMRILLDGPTAGWLRAQRGPGGLPEPGPLTADEAGEVTVRLSVGQLRGLTEDGDCTTPGSSVTVTLNRDEIIGIQAPFPDGALWPGATVAVDVLDEDDAALGRAYYQLTDAGRFTGIAEDPVVARFSTIDGSPLTVCVPRPAP